MKRDQVTRQDLFSAPLPENTRSYTRVSNQELIELIDSSVQDYGLQIASERFQLFDNDRQMLGFFGIGNPEDSLKMMVGIRNSYNKKRSVAIASGAQVSICSNGMVLGDIVHLRKHTGTPMNVIKEHLKIVLDTLPEKFIKAQEFQNKSSQLLLTDLDISHLLGEMFYQEEMLKITQLSYLKNEILTSEHFKMVDPNQKTAWNLYNNVTETLKSNGSDSFETHRRVHNFFEDYISEAEVIRFEEPKILTLDEA